MTNAIPDSVKSSKAYRRDIDGLRAISILAVVLFHAGVPHLSGGFVGVDVFFVISGYLIGAHVYADIRRGRFSIADFYRKRAKRILPALLVLLAVCYAISAVLLSPAELQRFGSYGLATLLSGSNIFALLKANYFAAGADQNPLLMTWSLGVEEQFYIFFPLLMILLARTRRKVLFYITLAIALASLLLCIAGTPRYPTAAFYLLPARAWELSLGVLMAIYENGRDARRLYATQAYANLASAAGLCLVLAGVFFFDGLTPFPGYAAMLPVLGAALVLSAPTAWLNRVLLGAQPLVFIGAVSYSFYLWHWPLLSFAHIVSDHPISVAMGCSIVALSFLVACLSYRFVEQPLRHSSTPTNPLLLRYALLCAVAALPALAFRLSDGWPSRFPRLAAIEKITDNIAPSCAAKASTPDLSSACIDTSDPRPAVALIGDSHAAALTPQLRQLAHAAGFKFYEIVKFSCPPLLGVTRTIDTLDHERECIDFNASVLDLLRRDPNVRTVVLTAYWAGPAIDGVGYIAPPNLTALPSAQTSRDNLAHGLSGTLSALRAAGKRVIVLQDMPVFTFDPVRRMTSNSIPLRGYLASRLFSSTGSETEAPLGETYQALQQDAARTVRTVADAQSVPVFDPAPQLCSLSACRFLAPQGPLYRDKQHVTPLGAAQALVGLPLSSAPSDGN